MRSLAWCLEYLVSPYDPGIVSWGYHLSESLTTNLPIVDSLNLVVCLNDFDASWNNCMKRCHCVANLQQQPFLFLPILWFSGKKFFPKNVGLIHFKCRKCRKCKKLKKQEISKSFSTPIGHFFYIKHCPQMNTHDLFRWCWASAVE